MRIVLLTIAFASLAAAQYGSGSSEVWPRLKREMDIGPFVGPEEGMRNDRERDHGRGEGRRDEDSRDGSDDDSNDSNDDDFDRQDRPVFFPPPQQQLQQPLLQPQPVQPVDNLPPAIPIVLPVSAQEGDGGFTEANQAPQPLPSPQAQMGRPGGFGRFPGPPPPPAPTTTTTTTTTPEPVRQVRLPGPTFVPPQTLTCDGVQCPAGSRCAMDTNRMTHREEPTCIFNNNNNNQNKNNRDQLTCDRVACSRGFTCQMQQTTNCFRPPCALNPVCIQVPQSPPSTTAASPPLISCDRIRCSAGTTCRVQQEDSVLVASCVSPCDFVNCPTNAKCSVNEQTLATTCVPQTVTTASCAQMRCRTDRRERCAIVQNCNWSRQCKDEARCIRF